MTISPNNIVAMFFISLGFSSAVFSTDYVSQHDLSAFDREYRRGFAPGGSSIGDTVDLEAFKRVLATLEHSKADENIQLRDGKKVVALDYRNARVSDLKIQAYGSPKYIGDILAEIKEKALQYPDLPIEIDFHGNLIKDTGISAIVSFLEENEFLKDRLVQLDLSTNRFGKEAFPNIKKVLDFCPNLRLDLSINLHFRKEEFEESFSDTEYLERITYNSF
tara:strand:- start:2017 stop:2676 length:660 start_codon:yes stop_codon:yes gene_type:complete